MISDKLPKQPCGIFDGALAGRCFAGCGNGYIHRLSADSAEVLQSVQISGRHIRCLYIVNDLLYAGCSDNCIYLLDPFDLSATAKQTGHQGSVFSLAFQSLPEPTVVRLNGCTGAHLDPGPGSGGSTGSPPVYSQCHCSTPGMAHFATASRDKNIRIWDASNYTLLKVLLHMTAMTDIPIL